jgi:hypothetical protein
MKILQLLLNYVKESKLVSSNDHRWKISSQAVLTEFSQESDVATTLSPKECWMNLKRDYLLAEREKDEEFNESNGKSSVEDNDINQLIEETVNKISLYEKEKNVWDAKNAVGKYLYELHGKLFCEEYEKYCDDKIIQNVLSNLRITEDWLYGEGSNEDEIVYVDLLKSLKNLGEPIRIRCIEAQNRQHYMQDLMKSIQQITEAIQVYHTKSSVKYEHIDVNEIEEVNTILNEKQKWYERIVNYFDQLKSHADPAVLCSHIEQKRNTLERECWTILNKPNAKQQQQQQQKQPPHLAAQQPSIEVD